MKKINAMLMSFGNVIGWVWFAYLLLVLGNTLTYTFEGNWEEALHSGCILFWAGIALHATAMLKVEKKVSKHFAEEAGKYQRIAKLITHIADQQQKEKER